MAKTKKTEEVVVKKFPEATVNDFNVIIKPIITEKTMKLIQENNAITVKVAKDANSTQIKNAFEAIFNVKVEKINIVNVRAKAKRVGRYSGFVGAYKKAIVKLAAGEALNLFQDAEA